MLIRQSQMGIAVQTDESTPATLIAADCSGSNKDHDHQYNFEFTDRGITRATLSKQGSLAGGRTLTLKRTDELVGGNALISSDAPWHRVLRACGFAVAQLKAFTIGSRTGGEFAIGQTVGNNATLGSATATGIVAYLKTSGTNKLVVLPLTGTFANGDTIYNYESPQVSATAGSVPANAGAGFTPLTETDAAVPPCVTAERRMGGEVHRIEGARGKATLTFEWSKPALLASEITGPCKLDAVTGRPTAASALSPVPAVGTTPLVCKSSVVQVGGYAPVMTKLEVSIDNTLAMRKTIAADDILSSGYKPTRIGDRSIQVKIDPEYMINSTFDIVGRAAIAGSCTVLCQAGDAATANGLVVAWVPTARIADSPSMGDRDGIATADVTLTAVGDNDNELYIFHVFL